MKLRLVDLHNDALTALSQERFSKYLKKCTASNVNFLASIWTTEMREPMREIPEYIKYPVTPYGVPPLFLKGEFLRWHIEDAWFLNAQNIDELIALRPFSVSLTWNANNNLAGGALADGGLTDWGKTVIKKLTAAGILVDLAHLNRKSFFTVAEILKSRGAKLLCTHTCFAEIHPHPRNLDREQIQTIVDSGGLVGLTLVGEFLCGKKFADFEDVYAHVKYFIENFGPDNLAIGTDFFGSTNFPKRLKCYKDFARFRKFLLKKGLSAAVVDKIFCANAYKIL